MRTLLSLLPLPKSFLPLLNCPRQGLPCTYSLVSVTWQVFEDGGEGDFLSLSDFDILGIGFEDWLGIGGFVLHGLHLVKAMDKSWRRFWRAYFDMAKIQEFKNQESSIVIDTIFIGTA